MNRKYIFVFFVLLGLTAWWLSKTTKSETHSQRFSIHEAESSSTPILAKSSEPQKKSTPDSIATVPARQPTAEEDADAVPLFIDVVPSLTKSKIEKKSSIPVLQAKEISVPQSFFKSLQDGQTLNVRFPIFDGKSLTAQIKVKKSKDNPNLYFLNGQVKNKPLSTISLTATEALLVGQINVDQYALQIQFSGEKNHFLLSVDENRLPKQIDTSLQPPPAGDTPEGNFSASITPFEASAAAAPGDVPVRVVVMYTAAAQTAAGGTAAIEAEIQNQIANIAHNSMGASNANVAFTVAHMASTPYVQSADQYIDLKRFSDSDDSFMDNIESLLKTHNAHLAFLYTATSSNYCGLAWLINTSVSQSAKYSFGMSARSCNSRFTVAHEIGHNFGADHNEASAGTSSQSYARGHINTSSPMFRDLMSYDTDACKMSNCPRVHMYSTPDVQYQSRTIGTASANNARRIREVAPVIAQFPTVIKIYPGLVYRESGSPVTLHFDKPAGTNSIQWYHWNTSTSAWEAISGANEDSVRIITPSSGFHSYYATLNTTSGALQTTQASVSVQPSTTNFTITTFDSSTLSAPSGASRTLTVSTSVAASSLNFQWQINGRDVAGATSPSFTLTTNVNQNIVGVKVSNSSGARHASRSMNISPPPVAPSITSQPSSLTRDAGQTANFSVSASGTSPFTYQWRRNGTAITGATSATYSITNVQNTHEGNYSVVVTNSVGSATSNTALLTVRTAPVIMSQPLSLTLNPGQSANFTVAAVGDPTPTYQWRRNGTNISGATSATYALSNVQEANEGNYSVVVTNALGSVTSTNALLSVNSAPAITSQPLSISRNAGQTAVFTVTATGTPAPTYQWRRNGTAIAGAISSSYSIANVQNSHEGSYSVVVANTLGSVTSGNATLTVSAAPVITTQTQNSTRTAGETATFSVVATGDPAPTYQWRRNGTNISGATMSTYSIPNVQSAQAGTYSVVVANTSGSVTSSNATLTVQVTPVITAQPQNITLSLGQSAIFSVTATGSPSPTFQWRRNGTNIVGATSATYNIASVQSSHVGAYSVVVTNAAGSVTSNNATLSVNGPPVIATQPQNITMAAGQTATFTVVATGSPTPTYQWRKDGTNLSGATSASYSINNVQSSHSGNYSVVVSNSLGSVTSTAASLTVQSTPVISTQPVSLTRNVGQSATFSVTATGVPSPTYQWRHNGTNISGATANTLSLTNVQSAQAGTYSVVVSNVVGAVTSANATLTLAATSTLPVFAMQPVSLTRNIGDTVSFSALANGSPAPVYQWYFTPSGQSVSQPLPAQNQSTLTLNNINLSSRGSYVLRAVNSVGAVNSSAAILDILSVDRGQTEIPYLTTGPIYLERTGGF